MCHYCLQIGFLATKRNKFVPSYKDITVLTVCQVFLYAGSAMTMAVAMLVLFVVMVALAVLLVFVGEPYLQSFVHKTAHASWVTCCAIVATRQCVVRTVLGLSSPGSVLPVDPLRRLTVWCSHGMP